MTGSLPFLSGRVAKSLERMKRSDRPETTKSSQIFDTEMNELHSNMKSYRKKEEKKVVLSFGFGPGWGAGVSEDFFLLSLLDALVPFYVLWARAQIMTSIHIELL